MDFGKLEDISKVDFKLPADNIFTEKVLKEATQSKPEIFVGPPIWSNPEWVGVIYPSNAKDKDMLYHYSRQFNTIELNVTHYQIPSLETIERWKSSVPEHFKFCPKFPQIISHERQLLGCDAQTQLFCESILGLGQNLGTSFLQLSPYFQPRQLKTLENFIKSLPKNLPLAVEFRHPEWFSNQNIWQKIAKILHDLGVSTVMTDVAGRRDVLHQTLTQPNLVLRFVGNGLHPTDYQRVDEWVDKIKTWLEKGLETAYIFVHCGGTNDFAPELTYYWIEQLNQKCGLTIKPPKILPRVVQGSLF